MLVYKEEASSITIKVSVGSGGNLLSLCRKLVVPRIYDGCEVVSGCRRQSTKCEIFSAGHHLKTQLVYQSCQVYEFWIKGRILLSSKGEGSGNF